MKKYVLFTCLLVISLSVFGQTKEQLAETLRKRGDFDSLFLVTDSQMSEIEKNAWRFAQQIEEFWRPPEHSSQPIYLTADILVNSKVDKGKQKSPSTALIIFGIVALFSLIFAPAIKIKYSLRKPRRRLI
ncbi:MAG: hypothetical protein WC603_02180 [Candidatus Paceibacterota bacterium]|jgi:hypothetical protein